MLVVVPLYNCNALQLQLVEATHTMGMLMRLLNSLMQRYFQVSPKLLGFGEACPGVLKVSCCGVALWALLKFGDRRVNDLELLYGYVVGVACLQREIPCRWICIHLACRKS